MSNSIQYQRGSEWRRWDLHVHSIYTHLNNQYGAISEDQFIQKIKDSQIDVIGLTNYFKFKNEDFELKEKLDKAGVIVFLNLELKLDTQNNNDECGDLHIVFNPLVTNGSIRKFLTNLNVKVDGDETKAQDLEQSVHFAKAVVSLNDVKEQIEGEALGLSNKHLKGCLSRGFGSSRSSASYRTVTNASDFLLHSSDSKRNVEEDRRYWLSEGKPLLQSSDAHKLDAIGEKFTWVKANLTFEGLKQIIYEPEDRVEIQDSKPEGKDGYQLIDRVKFTHSKFCPNDILLNQNLTTIIGGRSTGKSVLLRNIAQAIDSKQVENNLKIAGLEDYPEEKRISQFSVVWKDQHQDEKDGSTEAKRKIIYIPQSYLNRIADRATGKGAVKEIIEDILKQEDAIKGAFEQLERENRIKSGDVSQWIVDLFDNKNAFESLSGDIRNIGHKKGIEAEVQKLRQEISELNKKAGMTTEEMDNYNSLSARIVGLDNEMLILSEDLQLLDMLATHQNNFSFSAVVQDTLGRLSKNTGLSLRAALITLLQEANDKWQAEISKQRDFLKQQKIDKQEEKEGVKEELRPLLDKAKGSQSLAEKSQKLSEEEGKLEKIKAQEERLGSLKDELENLVENIAKAHSDFFENFSRAKAEIREQKNITEEHGLKFSMDIPFRKKSFQDCINNICDKRKLGTFKDGFLKDYEYSNPTKFKDDVKDIMEDILKGALAIKSEYDEKKAIRELTDQLWFGFDYKIEKDGDEISAMSPGKRSFVLLQLLIELDNSKCPILLDQPEDDLDNRSIYQELVEFIKTKKKERQIIIVTHNANLVVAADAECVIVANQAGKGSKNRKYQFEFVQGALENTFSAKGVSFVLEKCGIKEHVCDILEGGKDAFEQRKKKYNF